MERLHPLDIGLTFLGFHFVLRFSASFRDGRNERRNREAGNIKGHTLLSHFANSLQPTLPSQCYTYSTSPKALNSLLCLNRTNREKNTLSSAHSAPRTEHLLSLLPKTGVCTVLLILLSHNHLSEEDRINNPSSAGQAGVIGKHKTGIISLILMCHVLGEK